MSEQVVFQTVKLRVPQVRVLQLLSQLVAGGMTRQDISNILGNKTGVVVGRAVGYSDPDKRAAFEQTKDGGGSPGAPCPSLLTLGLVAELVVDLDGDSATVVSITDDGRVVLESLGELNLPPIRDSYDDYRRQRDAELEAVASVSNATPLLPY